MPLTYDPKRCRHRVFTDHLVPHDGSVVGYVWRCSLCGVEAPWGDDWRYWGNIECKWCWQAAVDIVACGGCAPSLAGMRAVDAKGAVDA